MNIISEYLAYLRDNLEGYWFKRKLYGWGWTPARPQGWLTLFAYMVGVIFFALRSEEGMSLAVATRSVIVPVVILTIILIVICYRTGEKPKWQWGKPTITSK